MSAWILKKSFWSGYYWRLKIAKTRTLWEHVSVIIAGYSSCRALSPAVNTTFASIRDPSYCKKVLFDAALSNFFLTSLHTVSIMYLQGADGIVDQYHWLSDCFTRCWKLWLLKNSFSSTGTEVLLHKQLSFRIAVFFFLSRGSEFLKRSSEVNRNNCKKENL